MTHAATWSTPEVALVVQSFSLYDQRIEADGSELVTELMPIRGDPSACPNVEDMDWITAHPAFD